MLNTLTCDIKASTYYFMLTSNKRCLSISIQLNAQCRGTQISSSRPWKNLEKNRQQSMKRKLCKDDGEAVPSLTIGKRILAPSNDWALTIALSLTGKNFSALVLPVLKCHGLETPERPGVKFIGARPVVNMLILITISTLCPQCRVQCC